MIPDRSNEELHKIIEKICECVDKMHAFQRIGGHASPDPDCKICGGTGRVTEKELMCNGGTDDIR